MINILTRKMETITDAVREFNENNLPHDTLPDAPTGEHSVLGLDANLPLIVRELAPLQLDNIRKEREKLQKRLQEIGEYENVLTALLGVVNPPKKEK